MKKIYEVLYCDYDANECFGSFEDENLAVALCEKVNTYFKEQGIEKEAQVYPSSIFDKFDKIYNYRVHLPIENTGQIVVEKVAPTYQPVMNNYLTIDIIKESINAGQAIINIVKYGVTEEEAKQSAIDFYNELEKHDLIMSLIQIINKKDQALYA